MTNEVKIIDCFLFYNEIDLLKYRLNILNNTVDYFVIVESTFSHSGVEKTLAFNNIKSEFDKFKDKIIHVIVDDFPCKYPNINYENNDQWKNENFQRNCISRGINRIENKNDNDIIIISDLDEIPDPKVLLKIKNNEINIEINSLELDLYYYNLNTKQEIQWYQSKILKYSEYKKLINCQEIRLPIYPIIKNAGWHLSYFGDSSFIKNKLTYFAHQEFNNDNYTNIHKIEEKVKNKINLFDEIKFKNISVSENTNLPPEYDKYLKKYYYN